MATSRIVISDEKILDLIKSNTVGIGQVFRYMNILPIFKLCAAGKTQDELWREYTLEADGISCHIREVFRIEAFE